MVSSMCYQGGSSLTFMITESFVQEAADIMASVLDKGQTYCVYIGHSI